MSLRDKLLALGKSDKRQPNEALESAIHRLEARYQELTGGDADDIAVSFVMRELTGYTFNELDEMSSYYFEMLVTKALERQRKTTNTTRKTTSEKKAKKRSMNIAAIDCCRRWKADKGETPMKTIVEDYVGEFGGKFSSIMRVLNDNPDQWKADKGDT